MKIIVIANGPVPDNNSSVVEGGGLRAWQIFTGLNQSGLDVQLALPKEHASSDGDFLVYENTDQLLEISSLHDAVIYSSSSGEGAAYLFENLPKTVIRIADAYVPIHLEYLSRQSENTFLDKNQFLQLSEIWNRTLDSANLILVANEHQRIYYKGLLAGRNRLQPNVDFDKTIIIAPFGIQKKGNHFREPREPGKKLLWWGGFYPWFGLEDFKTLSQRLFELDPTLTITVVGAANPFVSERNFQKKIETAVADFNLQEHVTFVDWLPFSARGKVLKQHDMIISLNSGGFETPLSWRTRLADCVEFAIPLATNAGDPFGDFILQKGGGVKLSGAIEDQARQIIESLNSESIGAMSTNLEKLQNQLIPENALASFVKVLKSAQTDTLLERRVNPPKPRLQTLGASVKTNLAMVKHSLENYGFVETSRKALKALTRNRHLRGFEHEGKSGLAKNLAILHQIDLSGAPKVGVEVSQALSKHFGQAFQVITPWIESSQIYAQQLRNISVTELSKDRRLNFKETEFFFVNSAAVPIKWLSGVLTELENNPDKSGILLVHENNVRDFLDNSTLDRIAKLSSKNLICMAPSVGSVKKLGEAIGSSYCRKLRIRVEDLLGVSSTLQDFSELKCVIVGPTNDDRKKHLDTLFGFLNAQYQTQGNEEKYRKLSLTVIGVGQNFISDKIADLSRRSPWPTSIELYPKLPMEEAHRLISESNVVISLSDNEAFPLYVSEAMSARCIVLRTNVSGVEEQLAPGKNGILIANSFELTNSLVLLADKKKTSDTDLIEMGNYSRDLISEYLYVDYEYLLPTSVRPMKSET